MADNAEKNVMCAVCKNPVGGAHVCVKCKNPVHIICGNPIGDEGFGQSVTCFSCST